MPIHARPQPVCASEPAAARSGGAQPPAAAPDYGSPAFAALRDACAPAWQAYVSHPFVVQLGKGELAQAAYIDYLVQDYLFLKHFARAWALVVVKAETLGEMRVAAATVQALVDQEIDLHVRTCERHGVAATALESAIENSATIAYTRYVLEAGFSGDLPELLAALAPCVFGYGEIGWRLSQQRLHDNPYQEWIAMYSGRDYQAVCRSVGTLFETSLAQRLGSSPMASVRWPRIVERFARATSLEVDFWQMALCAPARA